MISMTFPLIRGLPKVVMALLLQQKNMPNMNSPITRFPIMRHPLPIMRLPLPIMRFPLPLKKRKQLTIEPKKKVLMLQKVMAGFKLMAVLKLWQFSNFGRSQIMAVFKLLQLSNYGSSQFMAVLNFWQFSNNGDSSQIMAVLKI